MREIDLFVSPPVQNTYLRFLIAVFLLLWWLPLNLTAASDSVSPQKESSTPPSDPIRIIENNWSSQLVLSRIAGALFQRQGYEVSYQRASVSEQWGALAHGIDHVQLEVWQGTMEANFSRMVASGKILDVGSHTATTREDWWYPLYVEKLCPGLPDWRALKRCSAIFATGKTGTSGSYLAGPWEKPEAARVRALGLDFTVVQATSADHLWRALAEAEKNQQPIVLFNWTPNWVEDRYQGRFIEFPAHSAACEQDPSWGENPNYLFDCGNPKDGWLKKAAWQGFPKRWPCAHQLLENIKFTNLMIAALSARVDVDGLTPLQAANEWLEDHQTLWQGWLPTCNQPLATSLME